MTATPSHLTEAAPTLTIGVLARNEGHQIGRCLRSAEACDG